MHRSAFVTWVSIAGFLASILATEAFGQSLSEEDTWQQTFSGFTGIAFFCTADPEGQYETALCSAIRADAQYLAASSKTPFVAADRPFEQMAAEEQRDFVSLSINILASGSEFSYAAHVSIEASRYYAAAVDVNKTRGAESVPRSGTLVLWDKGITGSGAQDSEFKSAVVSATGEQLRNFFSAYLAGQTD